MSEVTIREYKQGDEHGIVQLFKDIFGREMTLDEWHWKYRGQGNEKVCSFVIADENGRVVGHYGGIPLRMTFHDKDIIGLATCDVMIHPEYRGIWVLKKLHHYFVDTHVKNGVSMVYGFPTEKTLLLPAEKKGLIERIETVLEASKELAFHNDPERFIYKLISLEFDDYRIDELWSSVRKFFRLSVIRDRAYFQWRYKRHPLFDYAIWGLTKRWSNSLLGLAIFKKDESENILLMDMVFNVKSFMPLLKEIENLAFRLGKKRLILWLPQRMHPELKKHGFVSKPAGATLSHSTQPATLKAEEVRSHFYYTCGDTDFL
ncbi:MAG: GNAT family N-acetyltransferase [Thermodesulfovibrionales bacterium]